MTNGRVYPCSFPSSSGATRFVSCFAISIFDPRERPQTRIFDCAGSGIHTVGAVQIKIPLKH